MKNRERGYLVVTGIFLALIGTIVYACIYLSQITQINYEIALMNDEIAMLGYYGTISPVIADMSIFNWAISAESAAFSIVAAAQFRKKRTCNVYEYGEQWLDKWFSDPEIRPYVTQIVTTWMQTNQNIG